MTKGRAIPYSAAELAWLEANRTLVISDYHRAFQAAFPESLASLQNLHALRKRRGWKVGRAPGRTKGRRRKFNDAEIAWLRENCTLPLPEYHKRFCEAFTRVDISAQNLGGLRKREGWKTGRTGQFAKGQAPANKGKTCAPGAGGRHPNSRKHQFRKGQEPHNTKFLGHERVSADGYVEISVAETNPYTGYGRRYVLKHVWQWEQANGPVPAGYCLKAIDGDRTNTDPANWRPIPRALMPALNGGRHKRRLAYDEAAQDLKPTLMAMAEVEHRARELRKPRKA